MKLLRTLALGTLVALALAFVPNAVRADEHSDEVTLGRQVYEDLLAKDQVVRDSPYRAILAKVGARVSRAAGKQWFTEHFIVVKGNQANAFAAPGGFVFVNEGLLRGVDDVDELANVLGHETAHLVLGHLSARQTIKKRADVITRIGKLFAKTQRAQNTFDAATQTANYSFLNFSRQQEYAADEKGVSIAAAAGYNPWGTVWFLRELERIGGDAGFEQYVQQHPSLADRIERIERYLRDHHQTFGRWSPTMPAGNGLPSSN